MSLINDAIKQANRANKERAVAESSGSTGATAGMREAANQRPANDSGSMTGMFLIAGIVVFVLLGGFLLVISVRDGSPAESPVVTQPRPAASQASAPARPVVARETPAPPVPAVAAPVDNPPAAETVPPDNAVAATPAPAIPVAEPAPAPVPAPAAAPAFPPLKLQGIYYRLDSPSVMINGKTLWVGDVVDGVKVLRIERRDVTVQFGSEEKVL
ncbi:MAG TPA: hypothetical protein DCY13_22615, partial [Verrucomicrobiales bacterium]|nr:hypothetical protein [Verrucomicrobiales bacterium]